MSQTAPSAIAPAVFSGLVFGFLGGAPLVGLLNCACCSLILGCGFAAALLDRRNRRAAGVSFDAMAGLRVGLLSGLVYAFVATATSAAGDLLFHQATTRWLLELLEESSQVDPEIVRQVAEGLENAAVPSILLDLLLNLALGMLFASLGGLIGGAALRSTRGGPLAGAAP